MTIFLLGQLLRFLGKDSPYLDPGSGSFLLQLLIAGLLGLAVAVRAYWSRIKKFFARGKKPDEEETDDDE